jgi:hypothetical protein
LDCFAGIKVVKKKGSLVRKWIHLWAKESETEEVHLRPLSGTNQGGKPAGLVKETKSNKLYRHPSIPLIGFYALV